MLRVIDGVRRYTANLVCKSPTTVISLLAHRNRSLTVNTVCKIYRSIELLHYLRSLRIIYVIRRACPDALSSRRVWAQNPVRRSSEATGSHQAPIGEPDDNTGKSCHFRAKMPPYPTVPVLFSPTGMNGRSVSSI